MADKKLAVIGGAFVASLLILCYFEKTVAAYIFISAFIVSAILFFAIRKREWRSALLMTLGSALAAVLFFGIYVNITLSPLQSLYDEEHSFTGTVYSVTETDEKNRVVFSVKSVDGEGVKIPYKAAVYTAKSLKADVDDTVSVYGRAYSFENESTEPWWMRYNYSKGIYISVGLISFENLGETTPHSINYYAHRAREGIRAIYAKYLSPESLSVVEGITLGEKGNMTDAQLTLYRRAGFSHAIAVSGMHLAFLVAMLLILFRLLRVRSEIASAVTICAVIAFMFLQGLSPSVTRAGVMTVVLLFGNLIGRERSSFSTLAFAAIVICLANPFAVCDVSFQLSFAAVLGIMLCASRFTDDLKEVFDGIRCPRIIGGFLSAAIGVSAAAVLFTAPVSIAVFSYVSPVAIFTNIFAVFAVEIIFTAGYLLIPLSFIPGVGRVLAVFIEVIVKYLNFVVEKMGRSLIAELSPKKEVLWITLALIVLVLAISALSGKGKKGKRKRPSKSKIRKTVSTVLAILVIVAGCLSYTYFSTSTVYDGEELVFSAVAVGQGDCLVISKGEKAVIVDCGAQRGGAADALRQYITETNIKEIEAIIVSHMHDDHVNGVAEIAEYYDADMLYLPREYKLSDFGDGIDKAVDESKISVVEDDIVLTNLLDGVTIYLYTDFADDYDFTNKSNYNKTSTIVYVDYGDSEFLLCGDTVTAAENKMIKLGYNLDADVLKVAHHGSKTSSGEKFLEAVSADIAVICYGDNSYGLPSPEIVERLEAYIPDIYDNYGGTVTLVTVGDGVYKLAK